MWKKCQPKSTCRFLNLSRDKNQIKCVPTCFGVKPNFSFKFHLHISQCNGLMLAENSKLCYSNSICSSVLFFFHPKSRSNQVFGGSTLHKSHFKKSRKNRFRNGSNSFNLSGNEFFWCQVDLLCLQFPYFVFSIENYIMQIATPIEIGENVYDTRRISNGCIRHFPPLSLM